MCWESCGCVGVLCVRGCGGCVEFYVCKYAMGVGDAVGLWEVLCMSDMGVCGCYECAGGSVGVCRGAMVWGMLWILEVLLCVRVLWVWGCCGCVGAGREQ